MEKLSICIVSMNHSALLKNCLDSIYKYRPVKYSFEIIVVDNCSSDDTRDWLNEYASDKQELIPIWNSEIFNFSKNNNIAIERSSGSVLLILNPDTLIHKDTLDNMIEFLLGSEDNGAATCKLVYQDGSFQYSARKFLKIKYILASRLNTLGYKVLTNTYNEYNMSKQTDINPKEVDYILGACMFIKKDVLDEVGLFDERFVLYGEDTDLCFRIKKSGKKIYYNPCHSITHIYARTSAKGICRKEFYLQLYTTFLFYLKNYLGLIK